MRKSGGKECAATSAKTNQEVPINPAANFLESDIKIANSNGLQKMICQMN
jgi:hypothetical protein